MQDNGPARCAGNPGKRGAISESFIKRKLRAGTGWPRDGEGKVGKKRILQRSPARRFARAMVRVEEFVVTFSRDL